MPVARGRVAHGVAGWGLTFDRGLLGLGFALHLVCVGSKVLAWVSSLLFGWCVAWLIGWLTTLVLFVRFASLVANMAPLGSSVLRPFGCFV